FQTTYGNWQFTVMPMGIKNGPAMFQRMISWVLRDVPSAVVYVDDVLCGTPEGKPGAILRDHYRQVSEVLAKFKEHKLCVKGSKVHLFKVTLAAILQCRVKNGCGRIRNGGR
ncbi:MAG: hypothetical protein RL044_240, partial [Actinomycetota bacterium]